MSWMNWDKPVPLIIGRGWPALWQIRALSRVGIPVVHAWVSRDDPAMFSRYAHHVKIPKAEKAAREVLEDYAAMTKSGMFLLDRWPEYEFLFDSKVVLDDHPDAYWTLHDKWGTFEACQQAGVATPKTVLNTLPDFDTPWVFKPCVKTSETLRLLGSGVCVVRTRREAMNVRQKIGNRPYIFQEWIPGEIKRLVVVQSCSDKNGKVIASFVFRKIRQYPLEAGAMVVGETHRNQEAARIAHSFLNHLGWVGLADTEFKLDPRDSRLKLVEVNTRLGKTLGFGVMCGVNLPLTRYRDFIGEPLPEPITIPEDGIVWADLAYDIKNCFISHREMYDIELKDWISTFWGKRVCPAMWARDDPLPWLIHLKGVMGL